MKLKFVLVPLIILGFSMGSYADGSKDEKSKWITPTQKVCNTNGGKMDGDTCTANWSDAKNICSASGGRLPSIDELKKIVTDCGGEIEDDNEAEWMRNQNNSSYQSCYKEKGFTSDGYWSSLIYSSYIGPAWFIVFNNGHTDFYFKSTNFGVRCMKTGQ